MRPGYLYAIVNDRPVIVEPRSRRIVHAVPHGAGLSRARFSNATQALRERQWRVT
jgi:uncharacterized protein DUF1236